MGSAPKSLEFGGGRRGTDSAEPFLSSIFKKQSEIFARKCYFDPFGNHESFRSDALCSEWDPNLREMGMEPLGKLLGAGMEPQPGLLGFGSRWGWIYTPTLSPHRGISGGAQGGATSPGDKRFPVFPCLGRRSEEPWPCGLSLADPNPFALQRPGPTLQIPWEKGRIQPPFQGGSHHGPGGRRGDIRGGITAWGQEGHGWRTRRFGGTKGPGGTGGTWRDH